MPVETIMTSLASMAAPPLFEDFMFQYEDGGVILNAEPFDGPFVDIKEVSGLDSAPIRDTQREREGMDGGFVESEFESARTIILTGTVYGEEATVEPFLDLLKANYAATRTNKPLYMRLPGIGIRTAYGKAQGVRYDINQLRRSGCVDVQFKVVAEDPRLYGDSYSSTASLGSGSGLGHGFNHGFPLGFGGTGQTGPSVQLIIGGNRTTGAEINIYGPVTNPSVYHEESGRTLRYNTVIGVGDVLTTNLLNRTVRLNGTANRRNTLLGVLPWFLLTPGNNTFRFSGVQHVAGPPNAAMEVITQDAYR
jgi:hypothetical protein